MKVLLDCAAKEALEWEGKMEQVLITTSPS
jgi:hypothetical protein